VYIGGYGGGGFDAFAPSYAQPEPPPVYTAQPQPAPPPVVIINQAYRPETLNPVIRDYSDAMLPEASSGVRTYQAPAPPPMLDPKEVAAARAEAERPTIFLIAFKDKRIIPALAFWVEGDTLVYVNREETINRASLELIDKEFSKQLNKQQKLDFNVP
jgi:hypothetical protein